MPSAGKKHTSSTYSSAVGRVGSTSFSTHMWSGPLLHALGWWYPTTTPYTFTPLPRFSSASLVYAYLRGVR